MPIKLNPNRDEYIGLIQKLKNERNQFNIRGMWHDANATTEIINLTVKQAQDDDDINQDDYQMIVRSSKKWRENPTLKPSSIIISVLLLGALVYIKRS